MDDKKQKQLILIGGVASIALWLWLRRKRTKNAEVLVPTDGDGNNAGGGAGLQGGQNNQAFYELYYQTNPGITDLKFGGDTSLYFNIDPFNQLSRSYIPMFGFVGVTAIGS